MLATTLMKLSFGRREIGRLAMLLDVKIHEKEEEEEEEEEVKEEEEEDERL